MEAITLTHGFNLAQAATKPASATAGHMESAPQAAPASDPTTAALNVMLRALAPQQAGQRVNLQA